MLPYCQEFSFFLAKENSSCNIFSRRFHLKRYILPILIAMCFILSIHAGGSREEEKVVIEYWTHEDANRAQLEERYASEFMQKNPSVSIVIKRFPSARVLTLVRNAFLAGEGPTLFNISSSDGYQFIVDGKVAPVDYRSAGYDSLSSLKESYIPGVLEPCTYSGQIYGLPLEMTNWAIFLNRRIFREAGLDPDRDYPRSWEDMVEISKQLVLREGGILVRRGFDFRYPYYLEAMVPMVEQLGGYLVSEDGKEAIVGEEAWVKWLSFMQEWGPNGLNLGSPTYRNARYLFNQNDGSVAMANTGLYQEARIKSENPDFYESGDWMVIPFPTFRESVRDVAACYYGQYFMVNASASKRTQEMSWAFIGYMLEHDEEYLEKVNILQPSRSLFDSDTYRSIPYSDVIMNDFARGHAVYTASYSNELQRLIGVAVDSVMLQGEEPRTAYLKLKSGAQELLDED